MTGLMGLVLCGIALFLTSGARAADCSVTSLGLTPLDDLGSGSYLGFQGGLYPGGANQPPAAHAAEGVARAQAIGPLDLAGNPDPGGSVVLLSIGMSNTTQEFCSAATLEPCTAWSFMGQAAQRGDLADALVIANGAIGAQPAEAWITPNAVNYDLVRNNVLTPKGLSEAQVRVVWLKQANPRPREGLGEPAPDALALEAHLGNIVRALAVRYPNIEIVFLSSRIYAGYATTSLNPEPYAYESAFSVKWLIGAQIDQLAGGPVDPVAGDLDTTTVAPWLAWGPYLWADGEQPRSDGLSWSCDEFESDGTHPARDAEEKVGAALLAFMTTSPFAQPWFLQAAPPVPGLGAAGGLVLVLLLLASAQHSLRAGPWQPGCGRGSSAPWRMGGWDWQRRWRSGADRRVSRGGAVRDPGRVTPPPALE